MKKAYIVFILLAPFLFGSYALAKSKISDKDKLRITALKKNSQLVQRYKRSDNFKKRILLGFLAGAGEAELLGKLLDADSSVSPDAQVMKYTLMTKAATEGKINIVKLLLNRKASIDKKDEYKDTPLKAAAREGQLDVAKYLILQGANVNTIGSSGSTPLTSATYGGHFGNGQIIVK